jgi:hypothetical protein
MQRIIYVENSSKYSSRTALFTGSYASLDEIQNHLERFIPSNPAFRIEFYNKQFGLCNRYLIEDNILPSDLECIYVYLRSKKSATCHICSTKNNNNT